MEQMQPADLIKKREQVQQHKGKVMVWKPTTPYPMNQTKEPLQVQIVDCQPTYCTIKTPDGIYDNVKARYTELFIVDEFKPAQEQPAQEPPQVIDQPIEPAKDEPPEEEEKRPTPLTYRPGSYVVDMTNKSVWSSGKGWLPISKIQTIKPMADGWVWRAFNEFKNSKNEKWIGKYDPANLKVLTGTLAYQLAGIDKGPTYVAEHKSVVTTTQLIQSSATVSLGVISGTDLSSDLVDAKKMEARCFSELMAYQQKLIELQPRLEIARVAIAEEAKLLSSITTAEQFLFEAQQRSRDLMRSKTPGLNDYLKKQQELSEPV